MHTHFKALWVTEEAGGSFTRSIRQRAIGDLPDNGILIKVLYSSLNYKDALSSSGNKGVTRRYPHTPGIDAAGSVETSNSSLFQPGDEVIVTGYDLGMNTPGGFGEYINVPAEWGVPKPSGLTLEESMILGTAGFTAALGTYHLLRCGQIPSHGPVLVTGATGGVGSLAVSILASNQFVVIASTGKNDKVDMLRDLGARAIIDRSEVDDQSGKTLLRPRWAGAIDTVGGNTLATALKACYEHGNVATCGNVSSPLLNTTVYPFILNGVNLLGINTATTPMQLRKEIWELLAGPWKPAMLHELKQLSTLTEIEYWIRQILESKVCGRVVLRHNW
jgi:acrylyl-CoA reductase (NADPH)